MPTHPSLQRQVEAAWARRGALAALLWPLSLLYRGTVTLRTAAYACGLLRSERLAAPVIVVGNLIAGGAGKTPATLALVDLLRRAGWTPGIVSRGYGGSAGGVLEVGRDTAARLCTPPRVPAGRRLARRRTARVGAVESASQSAARGHR